MTIPQCICSQTLSSVFPQAYQSVTNVVVDDGVTLMGDCLFSGCVKLQSIAVPASVTRMGDYVFKDCATLQKIVFDGSAPDVGVDIYDGTPRSLVTYVNPNTVGWAGGVSSDLPEVWNGRYIAYRDNHGGGGSSGGDVPGGGDVVQADARYVLTNAVADRAIASVTVDADCAIDSFVLNDGRVYDTMLRIVNTADHDVKVTLPAGYEYETFEGVDPLTIPANSRNMLSITRTAERTFLVSREKLKTIQ